MKPHWLTVSDTEALVTPRWQRLTELPGDFSLHEAAELWDVTEEHAALYLDRLLAAGILHRLERDHYYRLTKEAYSLADCDLADKEPRTQTHSSQQPTP